MTESIAQKVTNVVWQYVSASWPSKFHVPVGQGTFDDDLLANSITAPEWHQEDEVTLLEWSVITFMNSVEDDANGDDRLDGLFGEKQALPELERELLKLLWPLVNHREVAERYLEEYKERYARELRMNGGALGEYAQKVIAEAVVRESEYEKARIQVRARAKQFVDIARIKHGLHNPKGGQ
ncbi:MAG: hypothetical protein EBS00_02095 [Verrucomicrobia bacterium]|nr:hypothetical protein [Verrucomicrobiota bacterium]